MCEVCDRILEPKLAARCNNCGLFHHRSCRAKFFIGRYYYFKVCRSCAKRLTMVRTALQQDLDKAGDTWNEELWIHELVRSHRRRKRLTKPKYKYMHMLQNHVYELLNTGERLKTRDDSEVPSPRRESSKSLQREQSTADTTSVDTTAVTAKRI